MPRLFKYSLTGFMLFVNSAIPIYGALRCNSISPKKQMIKFMSANILNIVLSKLYRIENLKIGEQIV